MLERLCGEVAQAEAGRLGTGERAAERDALAGDGRALEAVNNALVLTEHIADLARADADVTCGNVGELADVAVKLRHEALAEAHDLAVGLALGVKVRAALAAAHGERGEGVLEDLLEAEELHDGEVDGRVEAQTALVGADRGIVLDAEAAVDVGHAVVVDPGDTELDNALRLDKAFEKTVLLPLGVLVHDQLQRFKNLHDRLKELRLMCIAALNVRVHLFQILVVQHLLTSC